MTSKTTNKFSPEVRARAVRMVLDHASEQAVRDPLGLTPDKTGVADDIANDVRTILGGLNSVVNGVGALRTHGGDAHGRERGYRRIDPRIARLAIHSASTVSLFLVETWQKKFPARQLKPH
ncbi:abortive infection family protein [Bradyrhizobium sp. 38]|nr:abortive infection family protein [Bradyrhizobium sp. 38]MCK1782756.1 abortive infection family protein [Bradyrhizobium sp. 132]